MSQHYKQMRHGGRDATDMLRERLTREEIGDAAYEKDVSCNDYRAFRIFGVLCILFLAVVVFAVSLTGY